MPACPDGRFVISWWLIDIKYTIDIDIKFDIDGSSNEKLWETCLKNVHETNHIVMYDY